MRSKIVYTATVALVACTLTAAEMALDTSGSYLPLLELPKDRLAIDQQKAVESIKASKVPSKEEALRAVWSFAGDKAEYMRRADLSLQVAGLYCVGRDIPGFASASDFVWAVYARRWGRELMQVFYVSTSTGTVLTVFPEAPNKTEPRPGAIRSTQERNRTSSSAGSRR